MPDATRHASAASGPSEKPEAALGPTVQTLDIAGDTMAIKIGNPAPNIINGTAKSDIILGLAGDDVIYGGGGNDLIDGGLGVDTAVFSGRIQDYRINLIAKPGLVTTVSGADGCDTLANVEILKFDNGTCDLRTGVTTLTTVSVQGGNTVREGDGHTLNYTFTRTGDLSGALDVRYGFDGTAGAADYADPNAGVIHFAAGSATTTPPTGTSLIPPMCSIAIGATSR